MKNLINYLSESVFDKDLSKTSNNLLAKEEANDFISKIYPLDDSWKQYDFRNSTIYPKNSKSNSLGSLIIGYSNGGVYVCSSYRFIDDSSIPIEEYSKMTFKWAGDITIHIDCIEKGVKLSDLHFSSDQNPVLSIGALNQIRISSKKLSNLLDKFIDVSNINNITLVISDSDKLILDDVDFLNNQKLGNFKSVVYNVHSKFPIDTQKGLHSIQGCPIRNLFISGPTILDAYTEMEFSRAHAEAYRNYIYSGIDLKDKYPDLQDAIITYLTDIVRDNPNTDIYLSHQRVNVPWRNLDEVTKISYKGRKLNYTYLDSMKV